MKLTKKHIPAIIGIIGIILTIILFARVPLEEASEPNPYDELEASLSFQLATVESQLLEDYAELHDSHELYKSKKAELAMVRQLQANWGTTGHIKPVYNVVEAKEPVKSKYTEKEKEEIERQMNWYFEKTTKAIPYKLGGKDTNGLDCSGLIALYGVEKGVYSTHQLYWYWTAQRLADEYNFPVEIESLERGDVLLMRPKETGIDHIVLIANVDYSNMGLTIIDASPSHGVSRRKIKLAKEDGQRTYTSDNGSVYNVFGAQNPIIMYEQYRPTPDNYLGKFKMTRYAPSVGGINCGGAGCGHFADGTPVSDDIGVTVVSCPFPDREDYRVNYTDDNGNVTKNPRLGKKLYVKGLGVVECKDTGGLITMKGQINKRGNVSSWNRLDIFVPSTRVNNGQIHWNYANMNNKERDVRMID